MANAPDELRKQKIAQALRPFLAEGEQLVVRQHDEEITAVSPATVKLREQHARLYGHPLLRPRLQSAFPSALRHSA